SPRGARFIWEEAMNNMTRRGISAAVLVLVVGFAASPLAAQQPQTVRLRGVIEKVDGNVLTVKGKDGAAATLTLTGNATIVAVNKASLDEIKEGAFIGSGAMPQADGTQKALEVHIFAESQRGTGEGHRAWDGAPNSTMTNGTVGASVTGVDGPVITVKYKDG